MARERPEIPLLMTRPVLERDREEPQTLPSGDRRRRLTRAAMTVGRNCLCQPSVFWILLWTATLSLCIFVMMNSHCERAISRLVAKHRYDLNAIIVRSPPNCFPQTSAPGYNDTLPPPVVFVENGTMNGGTAVLELPRTAGTLRTRPCRQRVLTSISFCRNYSIIYRVPYEISYLSFEINSEELIRAHLRDSFCLCWSNQGSAPFCGGKIPPPGTSSRPVIFLTPNFSLLYDPKGLWIRGGIYRKTSLSYTLIAHIHDFVC